MTSGRVKRAERFADSEAYREHPAPRRALLISQEDSPQPYAAARRALVEPSRRSLEVPELTEEQLRNLRKARRGAPVRALLDRLLDGIDNSARRGLVDPGDAVAGELLRLSELDPRWGFVQAVRYEDDKPVLDHWVVGPGGIYLLSAKTHPGSRLYVAGDNFLVDGKDAPYVPQARENALRGAEEISSNMRWDLDVMGVIVPVNDRKLTVDQQPYAVEVMADDGLAEWLVNRPEELTKQQIIAAYNAARSKSEWRPKRGEF